MIAHVAEAGEGRGRVVLHLTPTPPSEVAIEAAVRVARAFQSEIESLFVEDATLLEIAALPFTCEISLSGRQRRELSPESVARQMRAAASALARRLTELARTAEVPIHLTVVRNEPIAALAQACATCGPWNIVALGEPLKILSGAVFARLFASVPDTTGLIVVGPKAKRCGGRIVAMVEDIGDLDMVLRAARRLQGDEKQPKLTVLLIAESDDEAQMMDAQARLVVGEDETIEVVRARIQSNEPAMAAELIRRLSAGFIVGRFGGLVLPLEGELKHLSSVLECPLLLIR